MIEAFRHEVLNHISVISGFCEIIEHQNPQTEHAEKEHFHNHLKNIKRLLATFHATLLTFREGCVLLNATEETILSADPAGDILRFLSPECAIQYSVLSEFAEALHAEATAFQKSSPPDRKMVERCNFVAASADRLQELFQRPIAYMQQEIHINRQDDMPVD